MTPLIVDGRAPAVLPASPLTFSERDRHPLSVIERTIYLRTVRGWLRLPRGYVTDWASDPVVAVVASGLLLQPFGPWALGALGHDFWYATGQPGYRSWGDDIFRDRMKTDGVDVIRRELMFRAVRLGGQGGYDKAPSWWDTENFADPDTGEYPVKPPFAREEAFVGARWGLRPNPDWIEPAT